MSSLIDVGIRLAEKGAVPDPLLRFAISKACAARDEALKVQDHEAYVASFIEDLNSRPLAESTNKANEQHYELPTQFFEHVLGNHLKYSCCYYPNGDEDLDDAERLALELVCQRAELTDGQSILELGCGWGSLSLYMATQFPNSQILAISNSHNQRAYIEAQASNLGLYNLTVETHDINQFAPEQKFDRIVSVEMFEHVRNYDVLFKSLSEWINASGKLFVHVFCHHSTPYLFETEGPANWMGKYFFTGGIMPSYGLFEAAQTSLRLQEKWWLPGTHYEKTANQWLERQDSNEHVLIPMFMDIYGQNSEKWFNRWRIFFLACAQLFGYQQGSVWGVGHYVFVKP